MNAWGMWLGGVLLAAGMAYWASGTKVIRSAGDNVVSRKTVAASVEAPLRAGGGSSSAQGAYTRPQHHGPDDAIGDGQWEETPAIAFESSSEGMTYDLEDPFEKALLAASLRREGVSAADLPYAMKEPIAEQIGEEAQGEVYDLDDELSREIYARRLATEGMAQEDIRRALKEPQEGLPPQEDGGETATTYDLNDPADQEIYAAQLRVEGLSEKEIGYLLKQTPAAERADGP